MSLDALISTTLVLAAFAYVVWHMGLRRGPKPKVVVGGTLAKAMKGRR